MTNTATANKVTEIRWHARGGQGAVTAAQTLAEMVLTKDMFFQAFPEYGPERMGAPIQCFNRVSREPISTYCGVTNPHIVVVVDSTLMKVVDITQGLTEDGIIIINSTEDPKKLRQSLGVQRYRIYSIDATHISLETLKRFMPNIPVLGSLLKVTGLLTEDEAAAYLEKAFAKRFAPKVVENNIAALRRAFKEVKAE
ncbi:MAG: 2-oxoacid:acceptor oxidoreductase family protein [Dethiobacteria bacterium]|jgi:pyruvate ferredoxin oxidoreductase gamma subunit